MDSGSGLKKEKDDNAFTLHHYEKFIFAKAKEFNRRFPLHGYLKPLIGNKKEIRLADIGAGMFSTTGNLWPGVKIHVYPSDKLANEFMALLKKWKIKPLFPIKQQNMESLTYPDNFFDIVHCVNALDHCEYPDKAIKEMYRVCKPGGWIYFRHYFNTARCQKDRGMHQWNITLTINLDCIFWGKQGCFLLSDLVPGFTNVSKKELGYEKYEMIVSILQK